MIREACNICHGYGIDKAYLECIGLSKLDGLPKYCKVCTSGPLRAYYDKEVLDNWSKGYKEWVEVFKEYCLYQLNKEVNN